MIYNTMKECFDNLKDNVNYCLDNTDLKELFKTLDSIKGPTIICGVGGSSGVGIFLAKVLREKRHLLTTFVSPRDIAYMDLSGYQNIIAVSYSGKNLGVDVLLNNNLNKYLLTGNKRDDFICLTYKTKNEVSYVSLSATLAPMAILLMYYKNDRHLINEILDYNIKTNSKNRSYEVLSGYETITAHTILESSFTESGLADCVIHDKYNYCHGRINLTRNIKADLIFFKGDNELDDLYAKTLNKYYNNIITINNKYDDLIINDFYASVISLKLLKSISENYNHDLSNVKELEDNDLFYLYKGRLK